YQVRRSQRDGLRWLSKSLRKRFEWPVVCKAAEQGAQNHKCIGHPSPRPYTVPQCCYCFRTILHVRGEREDQLSPPVAEAGCRACPNGLVLGMRRSHLAPVDAQLEDGLKGFGAVVSEERLPPP